MAMSQGRESKDGLNVLTNTWEKRVKQSDGKHHYRDEPHVVEISFVRGDLYNDVADLLGLGECLGRESINVFNGVLPALRGLRGRQECHRGVYSGELEVSSRPGGGEMCSRYEPDIAMSDLDTSH